MSEPTIPVHVTQHFGQRIAELEAEVERLREALAWVRDDVVVNLRCRLDDGDMDDLDQIVDDLGHELGQVLGAGEDS